MTTQINTRMRTIVIAIGAFEALVFPGLAGWIIYNRGLLAFAFFGVLLMPSFVFAMLGVFLGLASDWTASSVRLVAFVLVMLATGLAAGAEVLVAFVVGAPMMPQ